MMQHGGWFGMGGMGLYWTLPILLVAVVIVALLFARRRSPNSR